MDVVAKHLATRGLEIANHVFQTSELQKRSDEPGQSKETQMSLLGRTIICLTIVFFAALFITVNYSIGVVVNNLTMIETPVEGISLESPPAYDDEPDQTVNKDNLAVDNTPAVTLVKPRPITSSIRTTICHLKANAGRWSRFRGLKFAIVHGFAYSFIASFFTLGLGANMGQLTHGSFSFSPLLLLIQLIGGVLVAMITVPLHMAWTHATIAMPSSKGIRARLPSRKQWRILWAPAAAVAVTERVQAVVMEGCSEFMGNLNSNATGKEAGVYALKVVFVMALALIFTLFITLPAEVTLTRIEASMLPEEEDTIVPFDRSFGGKVVPAIVGGTGAVGFWEAWRSFNWEARRRLIKLNVKLWALNVVLAIIAAVTIVWSFFYFGGAQVLVRIH